MKKEILISIGIMVLLIAIVFYYSNNPNVEPNGLNEKQIKSLLNTNNYEPIGLEDLRTKAIKLFKENITIRINITKVPERDMPYVMWDYASPTIKIIIDTNTEITGDLNKPTYDYDIILIGKQDTEINPACIRRNDGTGYECPPATGKYFSVIKADKIVVINELECYCKYYGTSREYCLPPDRFCV